MGASVGPALAVGVCPCRACGFHAAWCVLVTLYCRSQAVADLFCRSVPVSVQVGGRRKRRPSCLHQHPFKNASCRSHHGSQRVRHHRIVRSPQCGVSRLLLHPGPSQHRLSREDRGIFYQSATMTRLIRHALDDYPWDFIIPLDSDEFLRVPDRATLEAALAGSDGTSLSLSNVVTYVPTENDHLNEADVLRRIVHRATTVQDIGRKIGKVIIPGELVRHAGFSLNEGHHGVSIDGRPVPERWLDALSLAHFPVRSVDQFVLRTALCRLAWSSRSDYNPAWGWQYKKFIELLKTKPILSASDLTEAALLYVDIYGQPDQTPHLKILVRDPVAPTVDRVPARAMMRRGHASQSFWYGGPLSPYELFCLRSFIDWGHAVDLYSYDTK